MPSLYTYRDITYNNSSDVWVGLATDGAVYSGATIGQLLSDYGTNRVRVNAGSAPFPLARGLLWNPVDSFYLAVANGGETLRYDTLADLAAGNFVNSLPSGYVGSQSAEYIPVGYANPFLNIEGVGIRTGFPTNLDYRNGTNSINTCSSCPALMADNFAFSNEETMYELIIPEPESALLTLVGFAFFFLKRKRK